MRSRSAAALEKTLVQWEQVLSQHIDRAREFAREFFDLSELLRRSSALSRSLTDPARTGTDRAELARSIFGGKASPEVVDVMASLAGESFPNEHDLAKATAELGVETLLISAQHNDRLHQVEEELFRSIEFFSEQRELRSNLEDWGNDLSTRENAVEKLFATQAVETRELLRHALSNVEDASLIVQVRGWVRQAAERADHLTAVVTAAQPLDPDQAHRLTEILSKKYNRPVKVHLGIDPRVIGGLRVQIGADVIDGTLSTRLKDVSSTFRN